MGSRPLHNNDMPADDPQQHHYIPQFLLANFSFKQGRKGKGTSRLWVYDKWKKRSYPSPVRETATQRRFNEMQGAHTSYTLEPSLEKLETRAAPAIAKILSERSVARLTTDDRFWLGYFVAVQRFRVPQHRFAREEFGAEVVRWAIRIGLAPEEAQSMAISELDAKADTFADLIETAHRMVPLYTSKAWFLFEAPRDYPYWISDNPVVLANESQTTIPQLGRVGLAVPGIEIYLPLSKHITLALWCSTLVDQIRRATDGVDAARKLRSVVSTQRVADFTQFNHLDETGVLARAQRLRQAVESGGVQSQPENQARHLRELQSFYAYRYVYASENDFGIVEDVMARNPDTPRGPVLKARAPVTPLDS